VNNSSETITAETLSEVFERFARDEFYSSSPLYERLSKGVAQDAELLALAAQCRKGERIPNLLFAAVHYLLLKGISHPLKRFYKSLGGYFDSREDPFPDFRSFCLEQFERIRALVAVRMVQTNEVSRCAGLMPLFVVASKAAAGRPLFLVDLGASAGLNLFWDQYGYLYGDRLEAGDRNSPVQIECALRGLNIPPLPLFFPPLAGRVGVDFEPPRRASGGRRALAARSDLAGARKASGATTQCQRRGSSSTVEDASRRCGRTATGCYENGSCRCSFMHRADLYANFAGNPWCFDGIDRGLRCEARCHDDRGSAPWRR
jgi:hypothetical protein